MARSNDPRSNDHRRFLLLMMGGPASIAVALVIVASCLVRPSDPGSEMDPKQQATTLFSATAATIIQAIDLYRPVADRKAQAHSAKARALYGQLKKAGFTFTGGTARGGFGLSRDSDTVEITSEGNLHYAATSPSAGRQVVCEPPPNTEANLETITHLVKRAATNITSYKPPAGCRFVRAKT